MRDLLRGLLDLWVPPSCARCGAGVDDTAPLCRACFAALPSVARDRCARCQQAPALARNGVCAACDARASPLRACVASVWFRDEIELWIRRFKYPHRGLAARDAAAAGVVRALARAAAERAPGAAPACVIPVPLHARALRRRGFNPAALLARDVACAVAAPFSALALRRLRDTPSQTGLDRAARRRNVRGAFSAPHPVPERLWLVDDVVTTAATLEEAARALRRAGAREVIAICAARTPAPHAERF
ncbi:MAG: double zinc ribbon domain-containing protein [Myxococcales bacterium]|nr:double zinc ribbon domain-containing protein [Myxococcales bacterium]MDH5307712.1 double zinc ribbon domain-containing protein [Myxococcales bacterium]MDH5566539.1 double zinc ribbon domain-containing protein [Myxococcales bacterium]